MKPEECRELLQAYKAGTVSEDTLVQRFSAPAMADLGFAKVDLDREQRGDFPEVVYCEGKTVSQCVEIVKLLAEKSRGNVLATRCDAAKAAAILKVLPQGEYDELSRTLVIYKKEKTGVGKIAVISAGTSDLPVAEEAAITAEVMGNRVERLYDVGVAGIHRLLAHGDTLKDANALIVVAGMDGALPSVVGGLIKKPLIAVPTDVGYGASFGGLAALLAMLNSCAAGITVVNINNGFGAAVAASRINQSIVRGEG